MSYSLTVRTVSGKSEIVSESNVPDGDHTLSGHDDAERVDLAVDRRSPDGRYVVRASHTHSKGS